MIIAKIYNKLYFISIHLFKGVLMYKTAVGILIAATISFGSVYTYAPPLDNDLWDLPHDKAYSWGINFQLAQGEKITGATLEVTNVYNWVDNEWNALFIDLLDNAPVGTTQYSDANQGWGDGQDHDYFASWTNTRLDRLNWNKTSTGGGLYDTRSGFISSSKTNKVTINFTETELAKLTSYITNNNNFGFGIDADCHFYNNGFKFTMTTSTTNVPEPGTLSLLGLGLLALSFIRRRKK
jgi:hypothetical protein